MNGCASTAGRWVIMVSPTEPVGYLGLLSDEDDEGAGPPRAADPDMAIDFPSHDDAIAECAAAAERWPGFAFCTHFLETK